MPHAQRGVVLIIALILLLVISMLAVASLHNAGSSEAVLGNVRTSELATQAAEIALRHCESATIKFVLWDDGDTTSAPATFDDQGFGTNRRLPPSDPPQWQNLATWNSASTSTYVLPAALVNQAGMTTTYQRFPECMVEQQPVVATGSGNYTTKSYVITARGFGPEVPALTGATRVAPVGTVVWLQSTLGSQ